MMDKDNYVGLMLDNRYELLEKVGEGGMSIVYKARCHRLNRYVAVKILRPEYAQDEDFRRRFHAESQAVAMLGQPNIVAVYDVNRSQGVEYLVMELIDGITLKQYMTRKGQLNWRETLHFVTQIVRALGHAHSRGIVHRDIKPHNVMVLRDGSVKVADFGIARVTTAQSTLTQEALGSVHYISPEQAKGGQVDARSDLYSLGILMYELLTNRLPFDGDNAVSVAIQHINSMPLMPRELDPTIPEGLEEVTMKAMMGDIARRYQSADEMYHDLEEFRKNPAISFGYIAPGDTRDELVDEPTRPIPKVGDVAAARVEKVVPRGEAQTRVLKKTGKQVAKKGEIMTRKSRRTKGGSVAMLAAVLLVLAFVGVMLYFLWQVVSDMMFPANTKIEVPPLVGLMIEDVLADEAVTDDFDVVESGDGEYGDQPAGQIVKQVPVAGRSAEPGSVITVTLSKGSRTIMLEDYSGMEYRTAEIAVIKQGLSLGEAEYLASEEVAKGNVIQTRPSPSTLMGVGETVVLVISQGPMVDQVVMPDLVGDTETRAISRIEQFKLTYGGTTIVESSKPMGEVVWQSVQSGSKVAEGTVVSIQISAGEEEESSSPPIESEAPDVSVAPPDVSTEPSGDDLTPPSSVPVVNPPDVPTSTEPPSEGTYTPTIRLPKDRETVRVTIEVGGIEVYNKSVDTSQLVLTPVLRGNGSMLVNIYFDGVLQSSEPVDFN